MRKPLFNAKHRFIDFTNSDRIMLHISFHDIMNTQRLALASSHDVNLSGICGLKKNKQNKNLQP